MEIKRKMTKEEVVHFIGRLPTRKKPLSNFEKNILYTLEYIHYRNVNEKIRKRQADLDLYRPNDFVSFYKKSGSRILPSCVACLENKITHIRHSDKCNLKCDFCFYYGQTAEEKYIPYWAYRESTTRFNLDIDEMKLMLSKQVLDKVKAIGWLDKEPLMDVDKMIKLMNYIPNYQYLYTNGVFATPETLKRLRDAGLTEIRFNLQATDFADNVLKNMEHACKIIDNVAIETPVFSKSYKNILKYKAFINSIGIKQINLPELQLGPKNFLLFKDEGEFYRNRRGYTSPVSSRHYVYDIIELAISQSWDLVINDCSNDTKFFRDTPITECDDMKCYINHNTHFTFLPVEYYLFVVEKFVGKELEL
jgi:pyruvate formate-lyase activating enzyme-like uncharacterized protein